MFPFVSHIPKEITDQTKCIIMLHGVGSNEQDLFKLAKVLPTNCIIISLRAPFTLGFGRYAWYPVDFSGDEPKYDINDIQKGYTYIEDFLVRVKNEYHIPEKNIVLMGFSQGSIMSLYTLAAHPELIGGVICLSGRILKEVAAMQINKKAIKNIKVFIGHGEKDSIINVSEVQLVQNFLKENGVEHQVHLYPTLGHSISDEEVKDIVSWLQ